MELFEKILYVSEVSVSQEAAIARAVSLAENNQASLTVVDVIAAVTPGPRMLPGGHAPRELQDVMVSERLQVLEALVEPYSKRLDIHLEVLVGTTFLEVIRSIIRNEYDLLIKPAENPGFIERLFGSDDMQLLRNCPCPVWLTPADKQSEYTCMLAAIDFNPYEPDAAEGSLNRQILDLSSSLALSDFAALHVVHAWDAPGETTVSLWSDSSTQASAAYVEGVRSSHEKMLYHFREQLKERIGTDAYDHLAPRFHLRRGAASRVIPGMIKELQADLVVMGTVARTGIAGLLIGNTAEAVLEQVQCSVLAVKPPGFVSPVRLPR
ncbi:MAG: universal stress protein [Halioglobus sp.]|nr:universal stress protein [Halioglobus sp.]